MTALPADVVKDVKEWVKDVEEGEAHLRDVSSEPGLAAIEYAQEGLKVFPCRPRDKKPATTTGLDSATSDLRQIVKWWTENPNYNIGMAMAPSGLVAIDVDRHPDKEGHVVADGCATFDSLAEDLGEVPETWIQETGGGGWHLIFEDPGEELKGKAGPGLDIKHHGYILAAPSVHPNGRQYRWGNDSAPAELPAAWTTYLRKKTSDAPQTRPESTVSTGPTTSYGGKALADECEKVRTTPESGRNNQLNDSAYKLGSLIAGGEVSEDDARRELLGAGLAAGLEESETRKTVNSGIDAGKREPRSAPARAGEPATLFQPGTSTDLDMFRVGKLWPDFARKLQEAPGVTVPTGITGFDDLLGGGFAPGQVHLLSAAPGCLKTSFAVDIARRYAQTGGAAFVWSKELPSNMTLARLVCQGQEAQWSKVLKGECPADVARVGDTLKGIPLYVFDGDSMDHVSSLVDQITDCFPVTPPLVVIDYLQLLASIEKDIRRGVEDASAWVLKLAKRSGSCVLAISSTARAAYQISADFESALSMGRESGKLEFDCATVTAIIPRSAPEGRYRPATLVLAKNRLGGRGKVPVELDGLSGLVRELAPEDVEPVDEGFRGREPARSKIEIKTDILKSCRQLNLTGVVQVREVVKGANHLIGAALKELMGDGSIIRQGKLLRPHDFIPDPVRDPVRDPVPCGSMAVLCGSVQNSEDKGEGRERRSLSPDLSPVPSARSLRTDSRTGRPTKTVENGSQNQPKPGLDSLLGQSEHLETDNLLPNGKRRPRKTAQKKGAAR